MSDQDAAPIPPVILNWVRSILAMASVPAAVALAWLIVFDRIANSVPIPYIGMVLPDLSLTATLAVAALSVSFLALGKMLWARRWPWALLLVVLIGAIWIALGSTGVRGLLVENGWPAPISRRAAFMHADRLAIAFFAVTIAVGAGLLARPRLGAGASA